MVQTINHVLPCRQRDVTVARASRLLRGSRLAFACGPVRLSGRYRRGHNGPPLMTLSVAVQHACVAYHVPPRALAAYRTGEIINRAAGLIPSEFHAARRS